VLVAFVDEELAAIPGIQTVSVDDYLLRAARRYWLDHDSGLEEFRPPAVL
jgi:hypothetical protein